MHLSGSPAAARSRFLHALCTMASSFRLAARERATESTMPARQLGSLATLRQSRRDSRMDGNTERSCRLVPFATRLMDRSLGGVMPRGMDGLGSLLMQDDRNSGQELRRGGPRPNSGKDTRCTPAYREFAANRCCPWMWEGMELSPASRLLHGRGMPPCSVSRLIPSTGRTACPFEQYSC